MIVVVSTITPSFATMNIINIAIIIPFIIIDVINCDGHGYGDSNKNTIDNKFQNLKDQH